MTTPDNSAPRRRGRPAVEKPVSPAERARRSRAKLAGTVALTRVAAAALEGLRKAQGVSGTPETRQQVVERILVEAAARDR